MVLTPLSQNQDTTGIDVVVLAAGRGSRLGALGDETPKWLLRVGDRTIAERHLEAVGRAGDAVASVTVVTGHAADAIERALEPVEHPVRTLHVPEYESLNNWWSLLCALRALPGDRPVVVLNADLCAGVEDVTAFLAAARGSDDALLAVDVDRTLTDESMKVAGDGTLARIGKTGVEAPVGEYVGMLMARGAARAALRERLEGFVGRPEHASEWYERAVGLTAADGVAWRIWEMPTSDWVEIDDDRDLGAAEDLLGTR